MQVFGYYVDGADLSGAASIDGLYIGMRCVESGNLIGSCQIGVTVEGDDEDNEN